MGRVLKIIFLLFLIINLSFLGFFFAPTSKLQKTFTANETVKIYDRHNTLLYEVLNERQGRQSYLPLEQIPKVVQNAFLAIEDKRFYEHSGVDLRAILRAIWQNFSAGEVVSGGSTITQQLVRNMIGINAKRSLPQKTKETLIALKVGKMLDKNDVLELYLNSIYFGGLAYGVEAASWQYFNKSVGNLDLAEAAFLAGLPQAPNRYYPFKHFERAKTRQHDVLNAMEQASFISTTEATLAKEEAIRLSNSHQNKKAAHFVDYVLSFPIEEKQIQTTLDLGLQERIETVIASDISFLEHLNIENAAVVILDAKQGDILTMLGSINYENNEIDGQVNIATSLRQPGSAIKPLVYAAAIEKGWSESTIILDEPVQFETSDGLPYTPKNFDLQYRGEVTVAEALAQSLNIPAVKTLNFVGIDAFLLFAEMVGISSLNESANHYGLSLALGSGEVQLLELANAYGIFANRGKPTKLRHNLHKKIDKAQPIIHPETTDAISAILSNNHLRTPAFGEENPLNFSFPVAAKTGTTRHFRDNWTIGYTDDYVVGVWVGNASGEIMQGATGISGAGPIFYKVMNLLHESTGTKLTVNPNIKISTKPNRFVDRFVPNSVADELDFRIISPFANDQFLLDPAKPKHFQKIKLEASEEAEWFVNNEPIGRGKEWLWGLEIGTHEIKAIHKNEERLVKIDVF